MPFAKGAAIALEPPLGIVKLGAPGKDESNVPAVNSKVEEVVRHLFRIGVASANRAYRIVVNLTDGRKKIQQERPGGKR